MEPTTNEEWAALCRAQIDTIERLAQQVERYTAPQQHAHAAQSEINNALDRADAQDAARFDAQAALSDERIGSAILAAIGHLDRLEHIEAVAVARAILTASHQPAAAPSVMPVDEADQLIELAGVLEQEWLRKTIAELRCSVMLNEGGFKAGFDTALEEIETRCGLAAPAIQQEGAALSALLALAEHLVRERESNHGEDRTLAELEEAGELPGAITMARAALAAPLQPQPAALADAAPFMYAIMTPEGKPYFDEHCVDDDPKNLYLGLNHLNDSPDTGYKIVALYAVEAPPASALLEKARKALAEYVNNSQEHDIGGGDVVVACCESREMAQEALAAIEGMKPAAAIRAIAAKPSEG